MFNLFFKVVGCGFILLFITAVMIPQYSKYTEEQAVYEKAIAEQVKTKKVGFKGCVGMDKSQIKENLVKYYTQLEVIDMLIKRNKNLYEKGFILESQYKKVKNERIGISNNYLYYASCVRERGGPKAFGH